MSNPEMELAEAVRSLRSLERTQHAEIMARAEDRALVDTQIGHCKRAQFRSNHAEVVEAIRPHLEEYRKACEDIEEMERVAVERVREQFREDFKSAESAYQAKRDQIRSALKADHIKRLEEAQSKIVELEQKRAALEAQHAAELKTGLQAIGQAERLVKDLELEVIRFRSAHPVPLPAAEPVAVAP